MFSFRSAASILNPEKCPRFCGILLEVTRMTSRNKFKGTVELKKEKLRKLKNVMNKETEEKFSNGADYYKMRCQEIKHFKERGQNPYPHEFEVTISLEDFVNRYTSSLKKGQSLKEDILSVSGRILSIRKSSSKLIFYVLRERKRCIQILASASLYPSNEEFLEITDTFKRGDIIGIKGYPCRSKCGELSIVPINMQLLAPCLHLIPDLYYGLKNNNTRFKERCVDLFINSKSHDALTIHSDIREFIRNYLVTHKFFDAETPICVANPGGANAKPFMTHHNALDMNLYLRVSPELNLKKLIIGGHKRVFEIGRVFRNEGIDKIHHPEFTMCEFYMTDGNHSGLLKFVENLLSEMIKTLNGSYIIKYKPDGLEGKEYDIDFTPPFKRIKIWPALEDALGIKLPDPKTLNSTEANQIFSNLCNNYKIECSVPRTTVRLISKLIEHFLEGALVNPTFLCEHPEIISPLAKSHPEIEGLAQRFEVFVMGMEIVNAYSELNDPKEQRKKFEAQLCDRAVGDDEALIIDEDYLKALEYGLPVTHGCGVGIDRLAMLLTNVNSIKEVISFPLLKTE
ncbi:lysine--tRNA ligase [Nephila pilipes]|uniref:Lysine--tRNA ligase n=1 Tax=Nephila pilipes TaxID=299642 RepID=A0A8X6M8Z0_NEPPI|nr:lysine--tRNA ligase [Nephila pilipes]